MSNVEKPNLKHLRIFGCTAYAKELGQLRKLDKRSKTVKFVGYTQTGYRLWDPIKRKIIVSREVHFNEKEEEYTTEEDRRRDSTKEKKNKIYMQDKDDLDEDEEILNDNMKRKEDSEEEENEENITMIENNDNILPERTENTPRRSQRTKNSRTDTAIMHS